MRHFADGRPAGRYYADGRKYEPKPVVHDYFPEPDPLLLAGAADLRRQLDEMRGLVREMLGLIAEMEGVEVPFPMALKLADWVKAAREAAK